MILEDGNNIYFMFYFLLVFKKIILKNWVELPFKLSFELKVSCSTGDEWNLVCNKN